MIKLPTPTETTMSIRISDDSISHNILLLNNQSIFDIQIINSFRKQKMSHSKPTIRRHRSKEQYLRIFMEFDADNSGSVSKNQIVKMFKACDLEIDEEQAQDLINQIDADAGGELEQDQFIQFLRKEDQRIQFSGEELRKMFQYFWNQRDQSIGFQQLKHMFICLGQKVSDYQVSKMIIFADKNRDGKLDFSQFSKVIKQM